ncbi:MAG: hypothetical protein J6A89_03405 [Clostridia bacterium]|nr:hypothetical protein [Clostridia bacterium]
MSVFSGVGIHVTNNSIRVEPGFQSQGEYTPLIIGRAKSFYQNPQNGKRIPGELQEPRDERL